MLLPSPSSDDTNEDADGDENLRDAALLILRLTWVKAQAQLDMMSMEVELLKHAPPEPLVPEDDPKAVEDDSWKLDSVLQGGPDGRGPLLDEGGKVK